MAHVPVLPPNVSRNSEPLLEVSMLRQILTISVLMIFIVGSAYSHLGDGSHLHCEKCGNLAHSSDCPKDEGFWVGLGKSILGDLMPGSTTTDHIVNHRDPHSRYPNGFAKNFSDFMAEITVEPFVAVVDFLLEITLNEEELKTCDLCNVKYKGSHTDCIAKSTGY